MWKHENFQLFAQQCFTVCRGLKISSNVAHGNKKQERDNLPLFELSLTKICIQGGVQSLSTSGKRHICVNPFILKIINLLIPHQSNTIIYVKHNNKILMHEIRRLMKKN